MYVQKPHRSCIQCGEAVQDAKGLRVVPINQRRRVDFQGIKSRANVHGGGVKALTQERHQAPASTPAQSAGVLQVPLTWRVGMPPARSDAQASKEGRFIMQLIKSCNSWQALAHVHERLGARMNFKHCSAMTTHLTQLMVREAYAIRHQQQAASAVQLQQQHQQRAQDGQGQPQASMESTSKQVQDHEAAWHAQRVRQLSNYETSTSGSSSGNYGQNSSSGGGYNNSRGPRSMHASVPNNWHGINPSPLSSTSSNAVTSSNLGAPNSASGSSRSVSSTSSGTPSSASSSSSRVSGTCNGTPTSVEHSDAAQAPESAPGHSQTLQHPLHTPRQHKPRPPPHLPPSAAATAGLPIGTGAAGIGAWAGAVPATPRPLMSTAASNAPAGHMASTVATPAPPAAGPATPPATPAAGTATPSPNAPAASTPQAAHAKSTVGTWSGAPVVVAGGSPVDIVLPAGAAKLLDALLMAMQPYMLRHCQPRQIANCLWAVSKLRYKPPNSWVPKALAASQRHLHKAEAQHLANTLYAVAVRPEWLDAVGRGGRQQWLEKLLGAALKRLQDLKPRELAMLLWSIGQLHSKGGLLPANSVRIAQAATDAAAKAAKAGLLGKRELCNVLWAVARFSGGHSPAREGSPAGSTGSTNDNETSSSAAASTNGQAAGKGSKNLRPGHLQQQQAPTTSATAEAQERSGNPAPLIPRPGRAWFMAILSPLHTQLPYLEPIGLATMLLTLAQLGIRPHRSWVHHVLHSTTHILPHCGPGELSNIFLALAYFGYPPDWAWTAQWCHMSAQKLAAFKPQELANSMWALGRLRRPLPAPLFSRFLVASAAQSDAFVASETAQMLIGVSRMGYKPDQSWLLLFTAAFYRQLPTMCNNTIASVCSSFANLGQRMPPMLLHRLLHHIEPQLDRMSPRSLATIMQSLGLLAHRPPVPWSSAFLAASMCKMHLFAAQDLARCLWGVAVLGIRPGPAWMQGYEQRATFTLLRQQQEASQSASSDASSSQPSSQGLSATSGILPEEHTSSSSSSSSSRKAAGSKNGIRSKCTGTGKPARNTEGSSSSSTSNSDSNGEGSSSSSSSSSWQPAAWGSALVPRGSFRGGEVKDRRRAMLRAQKWDSWSCWAVLWACAKLQYTPGPQLLSLLQSTRVAAQQEEAAIKVVLAHYKALSSARVRKLQAAAAEGGFTALQQAAARQRAGAIVRTRAVLRERALAKSTVNMQQQEQQQQQQQQEQQQEDTQEDPGPDGDNLQRHDDSGTQHHDHACATNQQAQQGLHEDVSVHPLTPCTQQQQQQQQQQQLEVSAHEPGQKGGSGTMQVLIPPSSTPTSSNSGEGTPPDILVLQGLASWASVRLNSPHFMEAAYMTPTSLPQGDGHDVIGSSGGSLGNSTSSSSRSRRHASSTAGQLGLQKRAGTSYGCDTPFNSDTQPQSSHPLGGHAYQSLGLSLVQPLGQQSGPQPSVLAATGLAAAVARMSDQGDHSEVIDRGRCLVLSAPAAQQQLRRTQRGVPPLPPPRSKLFLPIDGGRLSQQQQQQPQCRQQQVRKRL